MVVGLVVGFAVDSVVGFVVGFVVAADPDVLFKVAAVSSGTTVAFYGQAAIGSNVALVQNSGSTTTGDSAVAINGTTFAATACLLS